MPASKPKLWDPTDMAYDRTVRLVVPGYEAMLNLVSELSLVFAPASQRRGLRILDIGSGTGAESVSILRTHPRSRVVAVDQSARMHEVFRARIEKELPARCRAGVIPVTGDIRSAECDPTSLKSYGAVRATPFDLVISSLTLHNLPHEDQEFVFRRIRDCLRLGGVFINADLFTFCDPALAEAGRRSDLDFIARSHDRALHRARTARARSILQGSKAWWTHHYINDNYLMPLESGHGIRGQLQILAESGFEAPTVVYRSLQTAVVYSLRR